MKSKEFFSTEVGKMDGISETNGLRFLLQLRAYFSLE